MSSNSIQSCSLVPNTEQNSGSKPFLIAGPCSAETPEQLLETAKQLAEKVKPNLFRAGIWKPRTKPGNFEGIGEVGLPWLSRVKEETGLSVITEIAKPRHLERCLHHHIDAVWIGARTTVSPFAIEELAEALAGTDIPIYIKNPINPDMKLWEGAFERIAKKANGPLVAIHRGFGYHGPSAYRNKPIWELVVSFKRRNPEIPILCDPSHISGKRILVPSVMQKALDMQMDGFMVEAHPDPNNAWSDAAQQLTPEDLVLLLESLSYPVAEKPHNVEEKLQSLRDPIDEADRKLLEVLAERFDQVIEIGHFKKANKLSALQMERWKEVFASRPEWGKELGLSPVLTRKIFKAIHQASIDVQEEILYKKELSDQKKEQTA